MTVAMLAPGYYSYRNQTAGGGSARSAGPVLVRSGYEHWHRAPSPTGMMHLHPQFESLRTAL